ncbi:hypothetical protein HDV00_010530 [Rhizophlyctis rosea]|nr:hypothetical protein HDV00_010530 [Rhizophlyctis rosea]
MATDTNQEESLRRYLEDQKVDPVEAQLNHIHLDIIKSLDRDRITDKTKYRLQQVIRSGQYTGWHIPREPAVGEVKEVVSYTNLPPNHLQIGDRAYQRFTFKDLYHIKTPPDKKLTFNVYKPGDPMAKGFLHKHDISLRDQNALNEIRKKQLGKEIDALRKLEKLKPSLHNAVGVVNQTHQSQIAHMANPIDVTSVPNEGVTQLNHIGRTLQQALDNRARQGSDERTALEALRYEYNLKRFDHGIQGRRGKGKGRPLTVQTNIKTPNDQYNYSLWTYSPNQYVRGGQVIQTTSLPFGSQNRDLTKLQQYVSEEWMNRTQAGGKLLEEAARVSRKGAFASLEPRKRRKTVGDLAADQTKVATVDLTNPTLLETVRRVSERIKKEQRAPIPRAEPVSQKGKKMSTKINKIYELKPRARMTEGLRNTIKADVLDAYPELTQTDKDKLNKANSRKKLTSTIHGIVKRYPGTINNESIESSTDDLIKQLVERYAGATANSPPQDDDGKYEDETEDVMAQDDVEQPVKKTKRKATEKQKAHLAKTRELALQKRREYAAQRKAEKEQAKKEAYEAELARRADEKLKAKVAKVLEKKTLKPQEAIVPEPPKKAAKKKRVIIEEEEESEEEVEIVRVPKRTVKKKTPIPKAKPSKPKAFPRQRRSPSPYRGGSMWDDYCMW